MAGSAAQAPMVSVIMGSDSDFAVMRDAALALRALNVTYETRIVSAHRTPDHMATFAKDAKGRGVQVIIAGAGGAAHLPGMIAAYTTLPVIGVPIASRNSIAGVDALLSIAQMPSGVPVATVAIGGATNAGLLAAQILALSDPLLAQRLTTHRAELREGVLAKILPDV